MILGGATDTLTANIRQRRGVNVCISVPLYRDVNTPEFKDLEVIAINSACCGSDSLQVRPFKGCMRSSH